jgi:carotenoid 1,2-hydratase
MTERGARHVQRSADTFTVGPSALHWNGRSLRADLHETGMPWPSPFARRVAGSITVHPRGLSRYVAALDGPGAHRWGPIAPCARVEVKLQEPALHWVGEGYLDSNEGDEPIDRPFHSWDWARAALRDGSTAVVYDVRPKAGPDRVIARHFAHDGSSEDFEAPPRQRLPKTAIWRIERAMRSDDAAGAAAPRVRQTLEDTPFYQRALVESTLRGERVLAMHETLSVPRLVSPMVRLMLPFRMPRRG